MSDRIDSPDLIASPEPAPQPPVRSTDEAIDALAAEAGDHRDVTDVEAAAALDYLLGKAPRPNESKRIELEIDFGDLGTPNFQKVVCRALTSDELERAETRAEIKDKLGRIVGNNAFTRSAWIMAQAMVEPSMGQVLETRNQDGGRFADAADLLKHIFELSEGTLIQAAAEVEKHSRIGVGERAAREVQAGKG